MTTVVKRRRLQHNNDETSTLKVTTKTNSHGRIVSVKTNAEVPDNGHAIKRKIYIDAAEYRKEQMMKYVNKKSRKVSSRVSSGQAVVVKSQPLDE